MSNWAGQSDRDRVLDATDLAQLIGEHIPLRPQGREHVGLCPFHDDSRPSLHVVTHKGSSFYKCFACGAAGSAIDFVMAYHKKDFPEALRYLADRAGITLTPRTEPRAKPAGTSRAALRQANKIAMDFFRSVLRSEREGDRFRRMLEERGISAEMIEQFKLGAAPDAWDILLRRIGDRGMDRQAFLAAGLLKRKEGDDRCYDAFRNRLIFPICDEFGAPIAFGGRKVNPEDEPKYLNSAESDVFKKSTTLFGLHLAKRAINTNGHAIVAEGYTDVIACHQAGITNVVATLGTALTTKHAQSLSSFCDTVIMLFDGDEAGQKAADRALAVFFKAPVDVKICTLPDGLDPDDLLRMAGGRTRLLEHIDAAEEVLRARARRFQNAHKQIVSVSGRQRHLEEFLRELAALDFNSLQGVRKRESLVLVSDAVGLPIREVESLLARYRPRRAPSQAEASSETATSRDTPDAPVQAGTGQEIWDSPIGVTRARRLAELEVLSILVYEPPTAADGLLIADRGGGGRSLSISDFQDPTARRIAELVLPHLQSNQPLTMQTLLDGCGDERVAKEVARLYFEGRNLCEEEPADPSAPLTAALDALAGCIRRDEYQRLTATCHAEASEEHNHLQAALEGLERRREQGLVHDAIADGV